MDNYIYQLSITVDERGMALTLPTGTRTRFTLGRTISNHNYYVPN